MELYSKITQPIIFIKSKKGEENVARDMLDDALVFKIGGFK